MDLPGWPTWNRWKAPESRLLEVVTRLIVPEAAPCSSLPEPFSASMECPCEALRPSLQRESSYSTASSQFRPWADRQQMPACQTALPPLDSFLRPRPTLPSPLQPWHHTWPSLSWGAAQSHCWCSRPSIFLPPHTVSPTSCLHFPHVSPFQASTPT